LKWLFIITSTFIIIIIILSQPAQSRSWNHQQMTVKRVARVLRDLAAELTFNSEIKEIVASSIGPCVLLLFLPTSTKPQARKLNYTYRIMVATAIYSVTMVLWKETAFPVCRTMERRWKRNVVSLVTSVIVVYACQSLV